MAVAPVINVTYNTPLTNCSVQFTATADGATGASVSSAQLLAGAQTSGPLFTFLDTVYPDAATAETAFRNVLGTVVTWQTAGALSTTPAITTWVASNAKPALLIQATTTTDAVYAVLVRCAHSIMR